VPPAAATNSPSWSFNRPGEGTLRVAKQLGLQQALRSAPQLIEKNCDSSARLESSWM